MVSRVKCKKISCFSPNLLVTVFCELLFQYCKSKLTSLELMLTVSKYVTSDIVLDRLIPFMVSNEFEMSFIW